jgi:uncharacterized membrane protein YeaQ/YmgE (transglycosylase-associated protein family)
MMDTGSTDRGACQQEGAFSMVFLHLAYTVTFSALVLQLVVGAIAAGVAGRAMSGARFGLVGDLVIGAIGAIAANFVVGHFALFNLPHYGLLGALIVAIIGALLLVMLLHLFMSRRSASAG